MWLLADLLSLGTSTTRKSSGMNARGIPPAPHNHPVCVGGGGLSRISCTVLARGWGGYPWSCPGRGRSCLGQGSVNHVLSWGTLLLSPLPSPSPHSSPSQIRPGTREWGTPTGKRPGARGWCTPSLHWLANKLKTKPFRITLECGR